MHDATQGIQWLQRELEGIRSRLDELASATAEHVRIEHELRESERRYRLLAENATDMISRHTPDGTYLFVSPASLPLLGYPPEELVGHTPYELLHPEDVKSVRAAHHQFLRQNAPQAITYRLQRKNGDYVWVESTAKCVRDPGDSTPREVITVTRNITKRHQAETALEAIIAGTAREAGEAFFCKLAQQLARATASSCAMVAELPPEDTSKARTLAFWDTDHFLPNTVYELEGSPCEQIVKLALCKYTHGVQQKFPGDQVLKQLQIASYMGTPLRDASNHVIGLLAVMDRRPLQDPDLARRLTEIFSSRAAAEIERMHIETRLRQSEEQLRFDALHDALTQLPNRTLLLDHLAHSLNSLARNQEYQFAMLFLDLDDFKTINDSLGHHVGDQLLLEVAHRLQNCVRPEDTVARLGGDEFAILVDFIHSREEAIEVAIRILDSLRRPYQLSGRELHVPASIGIAHSHPVETREASTLLREADTAMYRAKLSGKNRYAVFNASMHEALVRRMNLEEEFRQALQAQQFFLVYQPLYDLQTSRLAGFEALARWSHPQKGVLLPEAFIPLAEQSNLIHSFEIWVLGEVCRQAQQWNERFKTPVRLHINLSPRQLLNGILDETLHQKLEEHCLAPCCLYLEITESMLIRFSPAMLSTLHRLRGHGLKLSLDNFGTGYSSLGYLGQLPIDSLKIDRTFVSQTDSTSQMREVVRAICSLGQAFHLEIIAEGVESESQLAYVREIGCQLAQGYYLGHPLAAAEAEKLLGLRNSQSA